MTENLRPMPTRVAGEVTDLEPVAPSSALAKLLPIDADLIRLRLQQIEALKRDMMVEGSHYGTIPGTNKPTLYQAGAEFLALMFQLDADISVDREEYTDETGWPCFRAAAYVTLTHTPSGLRVATSTGEADTGEERYRWHRTYDDVLWEATPELQRRETQKGRKGGNQWREKQLRTHASDLRNTIIQMATKRAYVAAVKRATATSSMFTMDVEDMAPSLRGSDAPPPERKTVKYEPPKHRKAAPVAAPAAATPATDEPKPGAAEPMPERYVRNLLSLGLICDMDDAEWRGVAEAEIGVTLEELKAGDYEITYRTLRDVARGIGASSEREPGSD